ncbi:MAG: inositol monophosphatase family protein [Bdellovibrionia bacterium]
METAENQEKWQLILHHALRACRLGREVLLNYYGNLGQVEAKFQAGLVSEADKTSERVIQDYLLRHFPEYEFLGEEGAYQSGVKNLTPSKAGRWILDPLDGTTNYIHRFPIFCISLALEVDHEIKIAVIDVPLLNETYTAIKGVGAFLNGKKLEVSKTHELKDAFLATGFVAEHEHVISEQLQIFSEMVRKTRGIRRPGAAAYDLCLVAKGVFDGFWERNLQPWDSAAGILLVREAGGVVKSYRGQDYHPYLNSCVAGNSHLVEAMRSIIQKHVQQQTD